MFVPTKELIRKILQSMEMGYCRKRCRITFQNKITNEEIKAILNICTSKKDTIDAKRLTWYGHR